MSAYRPGRSRVARLIRDRELQAARIRELRAQGKHDLADQLERLGRAVDQTGAGGQVKGTDTAADPADTPWWDR